MSDSRETARRQIRPASYLYFWLMFAGALLLSHAWLLRLPYFWDEAGQFIPTALDLLHGSWIAQSTPPDVHPPGVPAYLALYWKVFGFTPAVTRIAMLLLSSAGLLAAFLLAIELCRETPGKPAFFAIALLFLSPLFFAQSVLAQLDSPAMVFTAIALLLFLQDHIRWSAAACIVLVLVKETGAVLPLILMLWLARERRWKDAAWYLASFAGLGIWLAALARSSGTWAGNRGFLWYNVYYPLHPVRLTLALLRRILYLGFANLHVIGLAAIVYAWKKAAMLRSRSWRVAGLFAVAQILAVTVLGGAVLERYLLPVLPIYYAAMAAGLTVLERRTRLIASTLLLAGLSAGIYFNPPYSAPLEDNLAFADFIDVHRDAAAYLRQWYPQTKIHAVWPLWLELARPELGYVDRPMQTEFVQNATPQTLSELNWSEVRILVICNQNLGSRIEFLKSGWVGRIRSRFYQLSPVPDEASVRARVPMPLTAHFERRGQWVDVYTNPALALR